ncbi:MAG: sensor histidine kinase [Sphingomonadales bacterium]|nr:sensor histidine kinase [Sphingomonadales bacterium]
MSAAIERLKFGHRLYLQIYLALLASLSVSAILFAMAHMRYGGMRPVQGTRVHISMLVVLMVIALVVALASYPVVRRLTGRLERLQTSVDAWGKGDLSIRVAVEGRDEVAQLAMSFNESAARVEALLGAQKTLLANASHELRSPLARIRLAVELLHDIASPEIRNELARDISELDQLIGEVLLASRLDAVAERDPVVLIDLTALVAEECARVEAHCQADIVEIRGDPALLRRMTRNLLENAQRHGGATTIGATLALKPDGTIRLDVCDNGAGVPADEREAIFAPFYRVRGTSESDGGYGLGLSLVRQIAQRHGGDVCYFARPTGGGCFCVTLPG